MTPSKLSVVTGLTPRQLMEQRAELLEVVGKWADIIQGGDKIENIEPWAQECVSELRAAIAKVQGGGQ